MNAPAWPGVSILFPFNLLISTVLRTDDPFNCNGPPSHPGVKVDDWLQRCITSTPDLSFSGLEQDSLDLSWFVQLGSKEKH